MKKQHLILTPEDFEYLQNLLKKGTLAVRTQKRAMALLELLRGKTYQEVSVLLSKSYPTVIGWARKYRSDGLVFLEDKRRPGRPVGFTGEERAKITALACSEPPEGFARWTLRLLADKVVEINLCGQISHNHVGVVLKKTNSSPTGKNNGASGN